MNIKQIQMDKIIDRAAIVNALVALRPIEFGIIQNIIVPKNDTQENAFFKMEQTRNLLQSLLEDYFPHGGLGNEPRGFSNELSSRLSSRFR